VPGLPSVTPSLHNDAVDLIASFSVAAAFAGAVGALLAWRAATEANRAAQTVAAIERARYHADLEPKFTISVEAAGEERATLHIRFDGPPGLDRLDEIRMRIEDDGLNHTALPGRGYSQEEIDRYIYRPLRFAPGTDGVDDTGRTVAPFSLRRGDWRPFALQRTHPPRGVSTADWRQLQSGKPIRLMTECRHDDHKPWWVPYEIPLPR
jgi:hypothetical protein